MNILLSVNSYHLIVESKFKFEYKQTCFPSRAPCYNAINFLMT